jgi:Tfp pilus assembly PilM family ATPase
VEGVLVALPQADLAAHLEVLREADLYPIIVDIGCMAAGNLFLAARAGEGNDAPACVVSLTRQSADIALLFEGSGIYPRTVYSRTGQWSDSAAYLGGNVDDVLKYCQFKLRQPAVQEVVVTGQVPADEAFRAGLGEALSVPVNFWDPVVTAKRSWRVTRLFEGRPEKGSALAASLGLALRR